MGAHVSKFAHNVTAAKQFVQMLGLQHECAVLSLRFDAVQARFRSRSTGLSAVAAL